MSLDNASTDSTSGPNHPIEALLLGTSPLPVAAYWTVCDSVCCLSNRKYIN